MVGLAQMVRASDCGPEGRRFDPDIPPHLQAGIVQWLVCKFSKLEMRVRFSLPAPKNEKMRACSYFFICLHQRETTAKWLHLCYNY